MIKSKIINMTKIVKRVPEFHSGRASFTRSINLLTEIKSLLKNFNLLEPNQKILIAFSTGQDSTYLLFFIFILQKQWNIELYILHCNHLWQKESFYTFLHFSKVSFSLKISFFYSVVFKIPTSEEKGRNWRLQNYNRLINFLTCSTILTGHTESDKIETFLFNLMRGASLKGISSLKKKRSFLQNEEMNLFTSRSALVNFQRLKKKFVILPKSKNLKMISNKLDNKKVKIHLIEKNIFIFKKREALNNYFLRPLINQSRFNIRNICQKWYLPVYPDKSNQEFSYLRNRIRKQLIPSLRFFFNPKIDSSLNKYTKILVEEDKILENVTKIVLKEIVFEHTKFFCINVSLFYSLPIGIQRKICLFLFKEQLTTKPKFFHIKLFQRILNKYYNQEKKFQKKLKSVTTSNWFFLPQIGIIFFHKKTVILFK